MAAKFRKQLQLARRYHIGTLNSLVSGLNLESEKRVDDSCLVFSSEETKGARVFCKNTLPVEIDKIIVSQGITQNSTIGDFWTA